MIDIERLKNMSLEEQNAELLDSLSDSVRSLAKHLAFLKAMAKTIHGVPPEDFDSALKRTFTREYDKVKNKSEGELVLMMTVELAMNGHLDEAIFTE